MKLYDVFETIIYQDGTEDCQAIGIFDSEHEANELCEKLERSIMYDSRQNRRYSVRVRELNECNLKVDTPKEGWVVLKIRYRYTGSMTRDAVNNPMYYILICEWFLNEKIPDENLRSDCVISYLPVIANEGLEEFQQRKVAKFHEMWEALNSYRRENNLVTLPFSITC